MKSSLMRFLPLVAVAVVVLPQPARAQHPQERSGFWINIGLGYGSLGCQDCGDREGGASGGVALGGTLSQNVLLGGSVNTWTKTQNNATLSASTVTAIIRFYPAATAGFFLQGGLGVGTVELRFGSDSFTATASKTGGGAMVGLGYDIRVGRNISITPFWNGYAISFDNGDANVAQIGLGITFH